MTTSDTLQTAGDGERIDGRDLQASIDALLALAKSLDALIADAPDVEAVQAIGTAQVALTERAMALVTAQIDLVAGGVRVTAENVNAAAAYAQAAVDAIADWKKKIATIGRVVDFFGVVMTGNGVKILDAAIKLKAVL